MTHDLIKRFGQAFRITLILLLLCGVGFPFLLHALAQFCFPNQANGNLLYADGKAIGSRFIGQAFTQPYFMKGRPSAYHYNTFTYDKEGSPRYPDGTPFQALASGSHNYAPSNPKLVERVTRDMHEFLARNPTLKREEIPTDLLMASGSGLDPHLSLQAARIQIPAIAKASGLSEATLHTIINTHTNQKHWGFLGEETVNVLGVNLDIAKSMGLIQDIQ